MKIKIKTNITNGKFESNINRILQIVKSFEGKELEITFATLSKQRSVSQNSYYWGVIVPIMQNNLLETGIVMDFEDVHLLLRTKFLKETIGFNEETGELLERIKSTTELSTIGFNEYMERIRLWSIDFFSAEIPEPNEQVMLNFDK